MISIEVTAHEGAPLPGRLAGEFDELGGSIGRTPGNNLVLPDPQRHISRTHASIVFRAGQYILRDLGSASPVILNGKALGKGNEAPIDDGDELCIAGYTLRVVAEPRPAPAEARVEPAAAPSGLPQQDPLQAFGGAAPTATDPFADLMAPSPASARMARSPPVPKSESGAPATPRPSPARAEGPARQSPLIPDDFDPFAEPLPQAAPPAVLPEDLGLGLGPATGKLDELFDLPGADRDEPFQPGNPLAPPIDDWRSSPVVDPLVALGAAPAASRAAPAAQRDDTPEIHGMFALPKRKDPAEVTPTQASQPAPEAGLPPDAPAAMSTEEAARLGAGPATDTERAPAPDAALSAAAGNDPADALLHAFLSGAGLPNTSLPGRLTPLLMKVIGQLLRECTQGTLDLLRARAMTKQQLRAEVTILAARENNPLKFSPTVEAALTHLLAPPSRGFMTPQQATKDAYNDLRAHELGFMAGMRAALAGVLARFQPGQLEQRLTANSVVDALLPINRKARLWDRFVELYADLSKEAEDDFQTLFGREFLRAYEAQIAEIERQEAGPRPKSSAVGGERP